VPRYEVTVENGHLFASHRPVTKRTRGVHPPHPLARTVERLPGPIRVVGISTTNIDVANPRYSTSDALLEIALQHATQLGTEVRTISLAELSFRACEGYYSKRAHACTWPCSITQMERVYEALVHWADIAVVATPIRWGNAASLYYRMAERLNCVQNQVTIANRVLIRNKVAAFIITGGQDNVQAVADQMLWFFSELGFSMPQFPYIAHSRGWTAEDMERNVEVVKHSEELRVGARSSRGAGDRSRTAAPRPPGRVPQHGAGRAQGAPAGARGARLRHGSGRAQPGGTGKLAAHERPTDLQRRIEERSHLRLLGRRIPRDVRAR